MRETDRESGTLRVEGLARTFGRKTAVREVSFSMNVGEVVGLLGPNGSGKTTVFYMIVGYIHPSAGRIYLNGRDASTLPMYRRARLGIAYLPQAPSIFRKLPVEQNSVANLETRRELSAAERQSRLDRL